MRQNKLLLFASWLLFATQSFVFAQPANNNCANATVLTSNAAQLCSQTTNGATTQTGEAVTSSSVCASSNFANTTWYRFTATSTEMFVELELSALPSGTWCPTRFSTVVYNTGTCLPNATAIRSCESTFTDGAIVIDLTTLTVGNSYLIQIGYNDANGCKHPTFCVRVGDKPTQCSCSNVCSHGCGYATTPTVAQVTSTCNEFELNPISDGGETHVYCYDFVAINSTVSYNMIITSNCSGGNVTGLSWTLQTNSCGSTVASGTLASMQATGLTIGTTYVLCYTYTIPTTCHHSSLYPYFVGAATPLPTEMGNMYVYNINNTNYLKWETYNEVNNNQFIVQRSMDGINFEDIGILNGYGTTQEKHTYTFEDRTYKITKNYYRIVQEDFDGNRKYYDIIVIDNTRPNLKLERTVNLIGQEVDSNYKGVVIDIYEDGSMVKRFQ